VVGAVFIGYLVAREGIRGRSRYLVLPRCLKIASLGLVYLNSSDSDPSSDYKIVPESLPALLIVFIGYLVAREGIRGRSRYLVLPRCLVV
jgi:hypothetical protein